MPLHLKLEYQKKDMMGHLQQKTSTCNMRIQEMVAFHKQGDQVFIVIFCS